MHNDQWEDYLNAIKGISIGIQDINKPPMILPEGVSRFDGNLSPSFLIRKFRQITNFLPQNIVRFDKYGYNTIKVKLRKDSGENDIYLFTYNSRTNWSLRTETFEKEIK